VGPFSAREFFFSKKIDSLRLEETLFTKTLPGLTIPLPQRVGPCESPRREGRPKRSVASRGRREPATPEKPTTPLNPKPKKNPQKQPPLTTEKICLLKYRVRAFSHNGREVRQLFNHSSEPQAPSRGLSPSVDALSNPPSKRRPCLPTYHGFSNGPALKVASMRHSPGIPFSNGSFTRTLFFSLFS